MTNQQVLEFTLNHETYCTNIEYVSEIVSRSDGDVTSVPNAPPHVEGVMDLRGDMTKIIDPRTVLSLDLSADVDTEKVIVFSDAGDDGENVGWAVTDVTEVST
ncbi:MAG: chemotaxis protein CheW, partial [Haloarculaceae archaeon]